MSAQIKVDDPFLVRDRTLVRRRRSTGSQRSPTVFTSACCSMGKILKENNPLDNFSRGVKKANSTYKHQLHFERVGALPRFMSGGHMHGTSPNTLAAVVI